jgi:hypothetical protein
MELSKTPMRKRRTARPAKFFAQAHNITITPQRKTLTPAYLPMEILVSR